MSNIRTTLAAFAVLLFSVGTVAAQSSPPTAGAAPTTNGASELADGEVRKVDKKAKKLTIKHGPLKNLDMPSMTMVFGVKDETVLDKLQPGEKVRFQAEKIDGKFTVTNIEAAR